MRLLHARHPELHGPDRARCAVGHGIQAKRQHGARVARVDHAVVQQQAAGVAQEAAAVAALKSQGMTVIEPDVALWRKPVLDTVPKKFEDKWGKGTFEALLAL